MLTIGRGRSFRTPVAISTTPAHHRANPPEYERGRPPVPSGGMADALSHARGNDPYTSVTVPPAAVIFSLADVENALALT